MDYESVGLRAPYRPKYFDRAEHHQTVRGSTRICCALPSLAAQSETAGASYSRPKMIKMEVHGKRWCG